MLLPLVTKCVSYNCTLLGFYRLRMFDLALLHVPCLVVGIRKAIKSDSNHVFCKIGIRKATKSDSKGFWRLGGVPERVIE